MIRKKELILNLLRYIRDSTEGDLTYKLDFSDFSEHNRSDVIGHFRLCLDDGYIQNGKIMAGGDCYFSGLTSSGHDFLETKGE